MKTSVGDGIVEVGATDEADDRRLDTLDRADCLALLGGAKYGRLAYCSLGSPRIQVVNFVLDGGDVLIRMDVGAKSSAISSGGHVAFEADRIDEATGTGWDVTVVGDCTWLTSQAEIDRVKGLMTCWAPGPRRHFARIRSSLVFGRRIVAVTPTDPPQA